MADTIRQVDYFYVQVPHKTGEGAKVLRTLKDANVNLLAFSGFPAGRRAQLDFIPADAATFKSVAKANKWKMAGPKRGFVIQGDDRVGAIADLVGKLPEQHRWLRSVLRGHYRYYGLPSNWHALDGFYDEVRRGWFRALRRRSQRRLTWDRFNQWLVHFPLPRAGIFHTREALAC